MTALNEIAQKKITAALKQGGCPANNTRCAYQRNGACIIKKPRLDYCLTNNGKLGCWDFDDLTPPVEKNAF
jgi:hypothetical protein